MGISENDVNGEWVDGPDVNRDINPSNLAIEAEAAKTAQSAG